MIEKLSIPPENLEARQYANTLTGAINEIIEDYNLIRQIVSNNNKILLDILNVINANNTLDKEYIERITSGFILPESHNDEDLFINKKMLLEFLDEERFNIQLHTRGLDLDSYCVDYNEIVERFNLKD